MIVYNFSCINRSCSVRKQFKISSDIELTSDDDHEEECPECHARLKLMGQSLSGGYNKFNSLSSEDKKKMLLKRSRKDFEKNIKGKKDLLDRGKSY